MKKAIISFAISAVLGFGLGYLVFGVIMGNSGSGTTQSQAVAKADSSATETASADQGSSKEATAATTPADQDNILAKRGCLGCHSVGALNLKGGAIGPDLSNIYNEVQGKHGLTLEQFLTKPNSAVMSGVIGSKPLTDDERKQVIDLLKKASETK